MAVGIALGNTIDAVGPALQKGEFVGVSIPIGEFLFPVPYPHTAMHSEGGERCDGYSEVRETATGYGYYGYCTHSGVFMPTGLSRAHWKSRIRCSHAPRASFASALDKRT